MGTDEYRDLFYPFDKLGLVKNGLSTHWNINANKKMISLALTFQDHPVAIQMQFQWQYVEPYDWIVQQFVDWAFTLTRGFLFYHDYDSLDEKAKNAYRLGMAAFVRIAPAYHIALFDKPTTSPTIV